VTFGDDKKGKVLSTDVVKVNDYFILNDVALVDRLRYNLLKSKHEVFEHFQSLALRLNNEHPNCLKVIHSDNGTEFRNASFDQFCLEHGVDQQFSAPRVPQHNGVI
jgi:IS30 family transposase